MGPSKAKSRPLVFEYLDYRLFLKEFWEAEKVQRPHFSLRFISGRVGINPGYIAKVFNGQVHLGTNNIDSFANLYELTGRERDYFAELVHFGRAKNENEIARRFERLQEIKGIEFRTIADDTVEFFRQWYNMAIRSLLSIQRVTDKDLRRLSSMLTPSVPTPEIRDSVTLMEKLGMVVKNKDGTFQVTEQFITTGEKWSSRIIREYQKSLLDLARRSLDEHEPSLRDISTVTMTVALKDLPAIRERIKQFRRGLLLMSQECRDEDAVMQLNVQLFPLALTDGGVE